MLIIKLRRNIKYLVLIFFFIFFTLSPFPVLAESNSSVKPSIITLGDISKSPFVSFDVTVNNNDETSTYKAIAEGNGSESIIFTPDTFELNKGESKKVKITINNTDKLKIGPYDLTIKFLASTPSKGWVTAKATSSLRLTFKISGISIASLNVKDIEQSKVNTFYVIYANFTDTDKTINSVATIVNTESNEKVYEIKEILTMKPFPNNFYGTLKVPLSINNLTMGDYVFKIDGATTDGKIVIHEEKPFKVGLIKGELISVTANDIYAGDTALLIAEVKNLGNLPLHTTFNATIKNSSGLKVFEGNKTVDIQAGSSEKLPIEWITKKVPTGEYTLDYVIKMGDETTIGSRTFNILTNYTYYIIAIVIGICIFIMLILFLKKKKKKKKKINKAN